MNIGKLIADLFKLKVLFRIEQSELKISAPKGVLTKELIEQIRKYKAEIVQFVRYQDIQGIYEPIPKSENKNSYRLSREQQALYIIQNSNPESTAYNMPMRIPLGGDVDLQKIESAFNELINRHEALRTYFVMTINGPVQKLIRSVDFKIRKESVFKKDIDIIYDQFVQPFQLDRAPLINVRLIVTEDASHFLLFDIHHIISDAVSHEILKNDFWVLYKGDRLLKSRLGYIDYSEWQNSPSNRKRIESQKDYWLNRFADKPPAIELPLDFIRPRIKSFEGATVEYLFDKREAAQIRSLGNGAGLTLFMNFLAVINIFLIKISGQYDLVIGTPVASRRHADLQDVMGVFINMLAIRCTYDSSFTVKDVYSYVRDVCIEGFENQEFQFADLVENLNIVRDQAHNPVFDVMFNMLHSHEGVKAENGVGDVGFRNIGGHKPEKAKFDLSITVLDDGHDIILRLNYSTKLFFPGTVNRFIGYILKTISECSKWPEKKICEIEILSDEEMNTIFSVFNSKVDPVKPDLLICKKIEQNAYLFPGKIAVTAGERSITYSELQKESDQLAAYLISLSVKQNEVIALLVKPSIETIIGIVGVLKAGCCFLPLTEKTPSERMRFMLDDSKCRIILTTDVKMVDDPALIIIDLEERNYYAKCRTQGPEREAGDIAYVIYTSGTTGTPKGVVVTQNNLSNYIHWIDDLQVINSNDRTILLTSYSFDLGYTALFSSLFIGCELHMVEEECLNSIALLTNYLVDNQISYIKLTPSLYSLLLEANATKEMLANLKLVILGGEPLHSSLIKKSFSQHPHVQMINHYGPTETTIGCIAGFIDVDKMSLYDKWVVIGKPIKNVNAFILNSDQRVVPIGTPGEICISGNGLSRGYLNNPVMTKQKFITTPYSAGTLVYRTGDIGKYLEDGTIAFINRRDGQVKIRGYRVELGEIETVLLKHDKIKECLVICREENMQKLIYAYIVPNKHIDIADIKIYLGNYLPDYMIPQFILPVTKFPLNANGKIDRELLPVPDNTSLDFIPPRNENENILADIWSEVLAIPIEKVSVKAGFFELGGHSLLAMTLALRINRHFLVEITIKNIFELQTVENISLHIQKKAKAEDALLLQQLHDMSDNELQELLNG